MAVSSLPTWARVGAALVVASAVASGCSVGSAGTPQPPTTAKAWREAAAAAVSSCEKYVDAFPLGTDAHYNNCESKLAVLSQPPDPDLPSAEADALRAAVKVVRSDTLATRGTLGAPPAGSTDSARTALEEFAARSQTSAG